MASKVKANVPRIMINVLFDTQECTTYNIGKDRRDPRFTDVHFRFKDEGPVPLIDQSECGTFRKMTQSQIDRNRSRKKKPNFISKTQNSAGSFHNKESDTKICKNRSPAHVTHTEIHPDSLDSTPEEVLHGTVVSTLSGSPGGDSLTERKRDEPDIEEILVNKISDLSNARQRLSELSEYVHSYASQSEDDATPEVSQDDVSVDFTPNISANVSEFLADLKWNKVSQNDTTPEFSQDDFWTFFHSVFPNQKRQSSPEESLPAGKPNPDPPPDAPDVNNLTAL